MRCSNCSFNNMPGSQVCGRCGTSLALAAATLDVHPPRATPLAKKLRQLLPIDPAYYGVRDALAESRLRRLEPFTDQFPPMPVLARLIVPGWSQLYIAQRWQGHVFFWTFVALFLPGLLMMGTTPSGFLLGGAFSVHSMAASDIINQASSNRGVAAQVGRSVLVSIVLALGLYWPAGALLSRVADPRTLGYAMPPLEEGAVVLVTHRTTPRPGSVVLYTIPNYLNAQNIPREAGRVAAFTGQRIDRILAGPGDSVEWAKGRFKVNGQPSQWRPLNIVDPSIRFSIVVPRGAFLIVPSATPDLSRAPDAATLQAMCVVSQEAVHGVVYAQTAPLSQLRVIR